MSAWKTYTQWGPDGKGFFLSDDVGIRFIEKARALGVKVICVHKGLPFGRQSYEHSQCSDIGVVAKRFPDVSFLVYHSGFVTGVPEQAYAEGANRDGIDTLIRSLVENGVAPNSNVYAELGSTWRFLMRDPEQAAHALGKLFKYCGENNVLWGTDSIWYGSPQDQIQAFRTFQISPELRAKHGYPEITPAAAREGVRAERDPAVRDERRGSAQVHRGATTDRPRAARVPRAPGAALSDLRAEDAARVPQSARLERRLARLSGRYFGGAGNCTNGGFGSLSGGT